MLLALYVHVHSLWLSRSAERGERGQASAEYALVLLGAAAVALLVVSWAKNTNQLGELLDTVVGKIRGNLK